MGGSAAVKKTLAIVLLAACAAKASAAEWISPTTGLPLAAPPVAPVLVSISHSIGEAQVNSRRVKAAGVGRAQPWGAQHADVVYESLLAQHGSTRMTFLFHDALVNGVLVEAGPVRSIRESHVALAREWRATLLYTGSTAGNRYAAPGLMNLETPFFSLNDGRMRPWAARLKSDGVRKMKAPDNMNVDVSGVAEHVKADLKGKGFCFGAGETDAEKSQAASIHINWGDNAYQCHYIYEGTRNQYLRFQGDAPAMTWHASTGEEQSQMAFSNLIIQYVEYDWVDENRFVPLAKLEGEGKATVFTRGRVMEGRWIHDGFTLFVDEENREIQLEPGRTYVAHLPLHMGKVTWESVFEMPQTVD